MRKVILDGKYELAGGLGSWAKSYERGVKKGDVRYIGDVLMFAFCIYPRGPFRANEINWCPVDQSKNTYTDLRNWVRDL